MSLVKQGTTQMQCNVVQQRIGNHLQWHLIIEASVRDPEKILLIGLPSCQSEAKRLKLTNDDRVL